MARIKREQEERETKIFFVILAVSVLIIAGFLIFANWKMSKKKEELLRQIEAIQKEIEMLEKKNQGLKEGINASEQSDYWETKIREQGYQKPGETAVIIKKEQITGENKESPKSIWEKFLAEIKGIF